jgi:ribosomal protein S18 acetylase RimI-like enzyme
MHDVVVTAATEVTPALVAAFERLTPQLSSSSPPPDAARLQAIIDHDACTLLIAREGATILGSLTLVVFPIPTGVRAWIEDVVVDGAARGKGVGELLNREALQRSTALGAKTVDLTSRPTREAANRLYARIGFQRRDTNVYRYDLG